MAESHSTSPTIISIKDDEESTNTAWEEIKPIVEALSNLKHSNSTYARFFPTDACAIPILKIRSEYPHPVMKCLTHT
jgi:hypothetical protein